MNEMQGVLFKGTLEMVSWTLGRATFHELHTHRLLLGSVSTNLIRDKYDMYLGIRYSRTMVIGVIHILYPEGL